MLETYLITSFVLLGVGGIWLERFVARRRIVHFYRGSQWRFVSIKRKHFIPSGNPFDSHFAMHAFFVELEDENGARKSAWMYASGLIEWFGRDPVDIQYVSSDAPKE